MRRGSFLSAAVLVAGATLALVLMLASGGTTGEYHVGGTLLCYDCHTIHFNQSHGWGGAPGPLGTAPVAGGDWLGATGPNAYLLKMPANDLCQACHDGKGFAPDVVGANFNTSPTEGRQAGALNLTGGTGDYVEWKGHTLGATTAPPGFDPSKVGLAANWYNPADTLRCIDCHAQHGTAASYRNLGPSAMGASVGNFQPIYVINTTNDTSKDVWVNLASYAAGSSDAATFNPYYSREKIFFNRIDGMIGSVKTSNKMGSFCAACHATFHGGAGDPNIGADPGTLRGFKRHPTAQVAIGAAGGQGYGEHSSLPRYVGAANKVKVATTNYTTFSDATPLCVTCHKGHGNKNPFGLIFMARSGGTISEEGTTSDVAQGIRNLCGQCHEQGA